MNEELVESPCVKSNGTKFRILYFYHHLTRHTDAEYTFLTEKLMKSKRKNMQLRYCRNIISDNLAMFMNAALILNIMNLLGISTTSTNRFSF